jgi:UDP-glucuronate decarboxylase
MKILITGGAGFVGSNLVEVLLTQGNQVWVVDNLVTGRKSNLDNLPTAQKENLVFIEGDVAQSEWLKNLDSNIKFDQIYHLASPASPPKYQAHPEMTLEVNTTGTKILLELALENNASFLYASTSEVYGDPEIHPQPESYWGNVNSFGERSCYDEAKRCGEAWCKIFLQKGAKVKVVRIFNTYGPNMDPGDGRVISNFVNQALKGENLTVYGDGSQTRSYCFVDDLVDGLTTYMNSKVVGEVINLGNPEEKTVLQTAQMVKQVLNSESEIVFKDLPSDDPQRRQPDLTKAKELLNWQPKIPFADGLQETIEYFRNIL